MRALRLIALPAALALLLGLAACAARDPGAPCAGHPWCFA